MGLNCRDCADHQQEIPAVSMVGKTPVCREHWRSRMGIPKKVGEQPAVNAAPPAGREEVKQMGRGPGTSQETIEAIRKDAAAGLSLNQIAEKHSVSWPTAKKFSNGVGKRPAGGGDTSATPKRGRKQRVDASSNGHFLVNLSIVGLDAVWNALPAEKKAELLGNL